MCATSNHTDVPIEHQGDISGGTMKALGKVLVVVVFTGAVLAAFRFHADRPIVPMVSRALVVNGDVVQVVSATGTLAPARSVAVSSQGVASGKLAATTGLQIHC